jgi:LmbE family N-acetylglucosaminyl deacetylase
MVSFLDSDRILVVAPHPDDESLGVGGLLQRAFAAGIQVRILFGTNGDNNPWVQRYCERRWAIGVEERRRWGQRRQQEALKAIAVLGGNADCARFMNFPDQGITNLLMKADTSLWDRLITEIREWQPTLMIIPTVIDSHPDHSALCVLLSRAAQLSGSPKVLEYLLHKPSVEISRKPIALRLTPDETEIKRQAILCHETQVALSGKRFTRFATTNEFYYPHNPIGVPVKDKPFQAASWRDGILDLRITTFRRERLNASLLMAFQLSDGKDHRWWLPLPIVSGMVKVVDTIFDRCIHEARIRRWRGVLHVEIPFPETPNFEAMFAKLVGWSLFFDRSGWFQIVLSAETSKSRPARKTEGGQAAELVLTSSPITGLLRRKSE